jgi:hypothetical protein
VGLALLVLSKNGELPWFQMTDQSLDLVPPSPIVEFGNVSFEIYDQFECLTIRETFEASI